MGDMGESQQGRIRAVTRAPRKPRFLLSVDAFITASLESDSGPETAPFNGDS